MKRKLKSLVMICCLALFFMSCDETKTIVNNIDERQANLIIVFLDSQGIVAQKQLAVSTGVGAESQQQKFNIIVDSNKAIEAMSILNRNGLPQRQGLNLLDLFAKQGLMTTDKEETIRYQAGLAQQITNMILLIDGVIDATVQLSFPTPEEGAGGETETKQKITASVFVKHQGVIDDPNSHLENKIKRLVSGSVTGLDINDVTVVSDRSRFTDVSVMPLGKDLASSSKELVKIWSITMNRGSVGKFRFLFFLFIFIAVISLATLSWILWKVYPIIKENGGIGSMLNPIPFLRKKKEPENAADIGDFEESNE